MSSLTTQCFLLNERHFYRMQTLSKSILKEYCFDKSINNGFTVKNKALVIIDSSLGCLSQQRIKNCSRSNKIMT